MSNLWSLRSSVVICRVTGRCVSTMHFQQRNTDQNGHFNSRIPLDKLSKLPKQIYARKYARLQSNQPESINVANVSAANRQRYTHNSHNIIDLTPLDDIYNDETYTRNIENYVGTVKVPIGMVNVEINGMYARGSYNVPLATTEAALVASYARGCKLINVSGGVNTAVVEKTVQRAPEFLFRNLPEAYKFLQWFNSPELFDIIKKASEGTTNHGKLMKITGSLHGNKVLTKFVYETGNASGQNISTFATNVAINQVLTEAPVKPQKWWLDAGGSQDKKTSIGLFNNSRGVYVTGEIVCPKDACEKHLKTSVDNLNDINESVTVSQHMQGCTGLTCHAANALSAIFIACGQDVACVAESHVGVTEMRKTLEGDLRVRVTIPSLMIGTVGGGTSLPSQKTCLNMLQLPAKDSRDAFAEVILGVILGGELSLSAAMTAHHFSSAHHKFARSGSRIKKA